MPDERLRQAWEAASGFAWSATGYTDDEMQTRWELFEAGWKAGLAAAESSRESPVRVNPMPDEREALEAAKDRAADLLLDKEEWRASFEEGWLAAIEFSKSSREAAKAEAERLREALTRIAAYQGKVPRPKSMARIARAALSPREDAREAGVRERVAEAIFKDDYPDPDQPWHAASGREKVSYRGNAEAAIREFCKAMGMKVEREEKRSPRFLAYDPPQYQWRYVSDWHPVEQDR